MAPSEPRSVKSRLWKATLISVLTDKTPCYAKPSQIGNLHEAIANTNDSIISIYKMSESDRVAYYQKHIDALKKADALAKEKADKAAKLAGDSADSPTEKSGGKGQGKVAMAPPSAADMASTTSDFYFYKASFLFFY